MGNKKGCPDLNGKVVRIRIGGDVCIASLRHDEYGFVIGHPYDTELKRVRCGKAFNPCIDYGEGVSQITKEEFETWKSEYMKFHKEIMEEAGYDSCEEDIDGLEPYLNSGMTIDEGELKRLKACERTLYVYHRVEGICPACGEAMLVDGNVCPSCGYDKRCFRKSRERDL
jgi:RNA polymerase subunit RPABC4/transcription elongation factor Spt4